MEINHQSVAFCCGSFSNIHHVLFSIPTIGRIYPYSQPYRVDAIVVKDIKKVSLNSVAITPDSSSVFHLGKPADISTSCNLW
ncbi:hypothetical protein MYP_3036 [Sporocytophaga myxococcoides]|uniref:Uncharacterized protein n=1 Tax=Sporocytophaga myxococcoides TaxID=153721 RepID=A0A098LIC6_9BACT|nr:hypothetical protein MYP_3036 [Sporocytophaga myxococcoides]